jgi:hypothetical protein
LHLFSFWYVRGSCFLLFNTCAFCYFNLCVVRSSLFTSVQLLSFGDLKAH